MTQATRDAQVLDFSYGNAVIDNPLVTKKMVLDAFRELHGREPLMLPPHWSDESHDSEEREW